MTTLKNAFATDRIAQGYMLTGVRGVGKTTTARILARALNYEAEGAGSARPSTWTATARHCAEIMEGRHPDVVEMDAASNTGVDNMREIIESARYKPLVARYKVYIIDEVHMLSKGAFNALLKTLEEPPGHVKFIFATTEIRKVPVTVLSRCQRFDLRRVDVPVLARHFARIVAGGRRRRRGRCAGADRARRRRLGARRPVDARPGDRDGVGQGHVPTACAPCSGSPTAAASSTCSTICVGGRTAGGARALRGAAPDGAEPVQVLADLADAVHVTTRDEGRRCGRQPAKALSAEERRAPARSPARCRCNLLTRAWQMLLKGLEEAGRAPIAAGRRRDGADPHLPHCRSADAGRDHPHARRRRAGTARGAGHRRRPRRAASRGRRSMPCRRSPRPHRPTTDRARSSRSSIWPAPAAMPSSSCISRTTSACSGSSRGTSRSACSPAPRLGSSASSARS